jgi:hypothetical protein
MSLHPCPSCTRHVRATETTCPFCAEAIAIEAPTPRVVSERLGRAALFAVGAAVITSSGCAVAAYGAPPQDSGPNDAAAAAADAGNPDSGFFPPYGTPPEDTGPPDDGGHDGGLAGAYGGPPVDSGP